MWDKKTSVLICAVKNRGVGWGGGGEGISIRLTFPPQLGQVSPRYPADRDTSEARRCLGETCSIVLVGNGRRHRGVSICPGGDCLEGLQRRLGGGKSGGGAG